ncbi:MAG TPA: hypothetical protein PLQ39_01480 [Acinetobacter sp.]|jgi:hypothetical protein|nr:hypothetical protein [Acinetobacter sp.]HQZ58363.1 hypothetical protein [Acinetobacter sp.]
MIQKNIWYFFILISPLFSSFVYAAPSCSSQNVKNQVIQLVNQVYTDQANDFMGGLIFGTGKKIPAEQIFKGEISAIRSDQTKKTANYIYCKAQFSGHLAALIVQNLANNAYYQDTLIGGCYQNKIATGCAATIEYGVELTEDQQLIVELYHPKEIEKIVTNLYMIYASGANIPIPILQSIQ